MGLPDKFGAATDRVAGAAKAKVGGAIGNDELQTHGEAQSAVGHAKQDNEEIDQVESTARDIVDRSE